MHPRKVSYAPILDITKVALIVKYATIEKPRNISHEFNLNQMRNHKF
jgi:hypothetical protein